MPSDKNIPHSPTTESPTTGLDPLADLDDLDDIDPLTSSEPETDVDDFDDLEDDLTDELSLLEDDSADDDEEQELDQLLDDELTHEDEPLLDLHDDEEEEDEVDWLAEAGELATLPWSLAGAIAGRAEPIHVVLDPTKPTSEWTEPGSGSTNVEIHISLGKVSFRMFVERRDGRSAMLRLGRDALSGRILVACD